MFPGYNHQSTTAQANKRTPNKQTPNETNTQTKEHQTNTKQTPEQTHQTKTHQTNTPNKENTYRNTHWRSPGPACTVNWVRCNRHKCQGRCCRRPCTWPCGFWFLKIRRWPPWVGRGRCCPSRLRCNRGFEWSPPGKPRGRLGRTTHDTPECLVCS